MRTEDVLIAIGVLVAIVAIVLVIALSHSALVG